MIKLIFFFILTAMLAMSCGGDKKSDSKLTNSSNEVNSIKKEKPEVPTTDVSNNSTKPANTKSEGATPEQVAKAKLIIAEVDSPEIDVIDSKKLYKIHCSLCHGFKGNMMVNGAKDLVKSRISIEEAVAQVYHGKGLMTPYKGVLSNAEIIAVSQYTETLRR